MRPIPLLLVPALARPEVRLEISKNSDPFRTIQEAVDAVPRKNDRPYEIAIPPGT